MESAAALHAPSTTERAVAVSHSLFDTAALSAWVEDHWAVGRVNNSRLLLHGQNDWYQIDCDAARYALRVLKSAARANEVLLAEIQWVNALHRNGFPVTQVIPNRQSACGSELLAPEGRRVACLYAWIGGETLGLAHSDADAFAAGQLLAQLHRSELALAADARNHRLADKLTHSAAALDRMLADDREREVVRRARAAAAAALNAEPRLPQGALHGDAHFGNFRRDDRGILHLLDFDDCGNGALAVDLTAFLWRNRCENLAASLDRAFLQGYEALRPLTPAEREYLPGLLIARSLYLTAVLARDRDILGRVPGFDKPWSHYLALLERLSQQ